MIRHLPIRCQQRLTDVARAGLAGGAALRERDGWNFIKVQIPAAFFPSQVASDA
jgi:hypothetical protein